MGRKIRFPLRMKNGAEVRTLDELKENFDLESVLGYFTDGKLSTWLSDRYYDEKAEAVAALSADMPDLNAKLCEILEVEYQEDVDNTDIESIKRNNEKYRILSSATDDRDILNNIDRVAMDQDELFDILDESPEKVYLYGDKFEIPFGKKNISYIGVNKPLVVLEKEKGVKLYRDNGIKFNNVKFEDTINPDVTSGERLFLKGKFQEAFSLIKEAAENGNPRAMYIMACYYNDGYETITLNKKERNNWCEKAYSYKEPLSMYGYAVWCLNDKHDEQIKIFSQIFNDIKLLAESDDAFAQGILGYMYNAGYCVYQDSSKAVEWYRKSAEQGYADAQNILGTMYLDGKGVTQDYAEAVKWYHKSAEQGYADAQNNLGTMYLNGKGVTQDYAEAVKWYSKSAEQGDPNGQCNLGTMYLEGKGVKKSGLKALELYHKSAEQGDPNGQCNLGDMYLGNCSYEVDRNIVEAFIWYLKAAEQGFARGQCGIAYMYAHCFFNSIKHEDENAGAMKWYRKAAEQDDAEGQYQFGLLCNGFEETIKWVRKAAEQGYCKAQKELGNYYLGGFGSIKHDEEKAIEWFKKAALQGDEDAEYLITHWDKI